MTPQKFDLITFYFVLIKQQEFLDFTVSFPVSLRRQGSTYPADILDALMLNLKESALTCNLDGLSNVGYYLLCLTFSV